jgi:hypothetical protein
MKKHHEVKHFNIPVDLSMYDKLPYTINPETKRQISLVSGNLLKYYYVDMNEEKKVIDPNDSDPNIIDSTATDIDSSFEGIKQMIEIGVLPSIIPFKPTKGSVLENYKNCISENLYSVTQKAAELIKKEKLDPTGKYGCIGCGACTLEGTCTGI